MERHFIVWESTYSVEQADLDEEHRKILSTLNRLYCMEQDQFGGAELKSILQDLLEFTESHCAHEEELMGRWNYAGLLAHRELHLAMIERTRTFVFGSHGTDSRELFDQSVQSLQGWWVNHIRGRDRAYMPSMMTARGQTNE
jgi:hemerythrin